MATFVLVHGAFVGGWSWRWLAPYLRGTGHEVHSPTLTGHGERAHLASPQIGLDTHIEDVVHLLHYEDLTGAILVDYSYGGMVVAGVADRVPERIGHVVYLDSDVPQDGDTSSFPPSRTAVREELARAHGDGWRVPPDRRDQRCGVHRRQCLRRDRRSLGSGRPWQVGTTDGRAHDPDPGCRRHPIRRFRASSAGGNASRRPD